ncbi:MAG TPA: heme exporter protein CcmD [Longimicrobiales bacterium]
MTNWFYVGLAYGVTYVGLFGYLIHLVRKRARAEAALRGDIHRRGD